MTPKQKTIVAISVVVLLVGSGYLYYEFVWKPKHPKDPKDAKDTKNPNETPAPTPPAPDKPASQYGFKPGDMLWTKANVVNVYNYPESASKYRVGYIQKQAQSQVKFIADSGTKGFVKANSVYFTTDGKQKKISDVYIPADQLTNVAP